MIDFTKDKTRYKANELGSLWVDERKLKTNEQPVIYIGGQMGPKGHDKESATGKTTDFNHNLFTGNWMYDYPLDCTDKMRVNGIAFAESLATDLENANLSNVILLTGSYGGIIGAYASKLSDRISQVLAVHPPFLGTPLANPEYLKSLDVDYTIIEKLLLQFISTTNPYQFGFEHDNFNGLDVSQADLKKLLVIANSVDLNTERNLLVLTMSNLLRKATGKENDGVIIFEPEELTKRGFQCVRYDQPTNHLNYFANGNMERVLTRYRKL